MNLESCFCFRMYLPCLSLTEKVEQNFQELNIGQDQRNSGYFQHFPVCPIITHWSTRRTIPVAFILISPFCVKVWFCPPSISQISQVMREIPNPAFGLWNFPDGVWKINRHRLLNPHRNLPDGVWHFRCGKAGGKIL